MKFLHKNSTNPEQGNSTQNTERYFLGRNFKRCLFMLLVPFMISTSCEDYLNLLPTDGLVEDEFWQKKEDVAAVLMGAYQQFAQLHDELFLYGELRADMIETTTRTPENQLQIIYGNIEPDNVLCKWDVFYQVINYCNFVITYAPIVRERDKTFTEFQMKAYQAEAIFLRSLSYFYLVRIFKEVPLVLTPTDSDNIDFFPPKSDDTTVLRVIKHDLEGALLTVKEEYGDLANNKGRANPGAINALLADISLWNFDYDECLKYINNIESMEYFLVNPGDYFTIFYPGNSLESIFEVQFDQALTQSSKINTLTDRTVGYYIANLFAANELGPQESGEIIRGNASLGLITENSYFIWKYLGASPDGLTYRGSTTNRSQHWIVYRYSEILLMKAEALSQKTNPDYAGALEILNLLRARALVNPLALSDNAVAYEDAILLERAKELAYEGKRWYDLVRMGRRNDYTRKDNLIKIIIEDVSSTQKLVLAAKLTDPYGWYLPIFIDEVDSNSNLEQNPFYQSYQ